jgi:YVTN family beta-propeller protein
VTRVKRTSKGKGHRVQVKSVLRLFRFEGCLLSSALLLCGSAPSSAQGEPGAAYVANTVSAGISVVDTATDAVTTTIPLISAPRDVAVSPDGRQVYVAARSPDALFVIDTRTNTVDMLPQSDMARPQGIAVSPDGLFVYMTNFGRNEVVVLDAGTPHTLRATIAVGAGPNRVAVAPDGAAAYVTNSTDNSVAVIDTAKVVDDPLHAVSALAGGVKPIGVAVTPDSSLIYVTNFGDNTVSVFQRLPGPVVTVLGSPIPVGSSPASVAIANVPGRGTLAYVANSGDMTVSVIGADPTDTATFNRVIEPIANVGQHPSAIAFTGSGRRAYVTNIVVDPQGVVQNGSISAIDAVPTPAAVNQDAITVGQVPVAVAIHSLPTNTPTVTATETVTSSPSESPTETPTPLPSPSPSDTPTETVTQARTPSDTPTETVTVTPTPSPTPAETVTGTPTQTPTGTPTPTFPSMLTACTLGWPTPGFTGCALGAVRGPTPFNENGVLKAIRPVGAAPPGTTSINLFYGDQHALALGARRLGTTTCTVEPTPAAPECRDNPAVGCLTATDPANRPLWPALFITDITFDANSRAGDWQCGGSPQPPSSVCGVWKSFSNRTPGPDPTPNGSNLGTGADLYPALPDDSCSCVDSANCSCEAEAFGAELRWNLLDLNDGVGNPLIFGHAYRVQVLVHDGDQDQVGGDVGEACVNVCLGSACGPVVTATPSVSPTNSPTASGTTSPSVSPTTTETLTPSVSPTMTATPTVPVTGGCCSDIDCGPDEVCLGAPPGCDPVRCQFLSNCGTCEAFFPFCGNRTCDPGETCADCPEDCGFCPSQTPTPTITPTPSATGTPLPGHCPSNCPPPDGYGCTAPVGSYSQDILEGGEPPLFCCRLSDTSICVATLTPTVTPTRTPMHTSTSTPTQTATNTPANTPSATSTDTPTQTRPPTATRTKTATPTQVPTGTRTVTATSTPTQTPTNSRSPTVTPSRTNTATPSPSRTATTPPSGTPTATPTQTPQSSPTFTPTATKSLTPSATPTGKGTPTATPITCAGDCDGSQEVTASELFTMVNVALGTRALSACTAGDVDGSGRITVNEIVMALNRALTHCPSP